MHKLVLILLFTYAAPSHAGLMDDIMTWFSGDEASTEETAKPATLTDTAKAAAATAAIKTSVQFIPTVVKALGVTEEQARGGMGAIFMAAKAALSPEDYQLISQAVPDVERYISEAPKVNELIGSAMNLLGGSSETAAAANLVGQFNKLDLSPSMIGSFGEQAAAYVKEKSPEGSKNLMSVLSDYL